MLFSFQMVCAANVDCDPRIVSVPSVQRAPKTHWFEGTRPQLQSLVLCLSCLAGLANSFKHPQHCSSGGIMSASVLGRLREIPSSPSVYAEQMLSEWQLPVLEKGNMSPKDILNQPFCWYYLGVFWKRQHVKLRVLRHQGRSQGWYSVPGSFQYLSTLCLR